MCPGPSTPRVVFQVLETTYIGTQARGPNSIRANRNGPPVYPAASQGVSRAPRVMCNQQSKSRVAHDATIDLGCRKMAEGADENGQEKTCLASSRNMPGQRGLRASLGTYFFPSLFRLTHEATAARPLMRLLAA